jgi:hypothetical protein
MREGGDEMSAVVVTSNYGERFKYASIARLALAYGDWHEDTHTIIAELLEVLFERKIINADDLMRILNMYHYKSIEKEVQG